MAQYHINPANGNTGLCRAQHACPFGSSADHYDTPDQARHAYERRMVAFSPKPVSLKRLTRESLKEALIDEADLSLGFKARLELAVNVADKLHYGQTRKAAIQGRFNTPYVEHPLRNALRLVRLGVRSPQVLEATVLHDTVEDCARRFLELHDMEEVSPEEQRQMLANYIGELFEPKTKRLVLAVTNPYEPSSVRKKMSTEEKHRKYAAGVTEEIQEDPEVFLVKYSDYIDNAGSLHHSLPHEVEKAKVLAAKYLPLIPVFIAALDKHRDALINEVGLPPDSIEAMRSKLEATGARMEELLTR